MYTYMYIYIHVYVYMYIYMYTYKERERASWRDGSPLQPRRHSPWRSPRWSPSRAAPAQTPRGTRGWASRTLSAPAVPPPVSPGHAFRILRNLHDLGVLVTRIATQLRKLLHNRGMPVIVTDVWQLLQTDSVVIFADRCSLPRRTGLNVTGMQGLGQ